MSIKPVSRCLAEMKAEETAEQYCSRRVLERELENREFNNTLVKFYVLQYDMKREDMVKLLGQMARYIIGSGPSLDIDELFTFQLLWGSKSVLVTGTFSAVESSYRVISINQKI